MMKAAGVEIGSTARRWYNLGRLNNRTHRKLLVVDGRIGFTGGVGIAEQWTGHAQDSEHWRDTHFRVEGPVVAQMQAAFMDNWIKTSGDGPARRRILSRHRGKRTDSAQVFSSSPSGGGESMELMYLLSITAAARTIRLSSAYFVPNELAVKTMVDALKRGVKIQIITPGAHIDTETVRAASKARWGDLLEAGAEIYEYQPTMYHCKVMIVDEFMVSTGSTNFDDRSFRLNDEANLNIYDTVFAQQQVQIFDADRAKSRRVSLAQWQARPWTEKAWEHVASLLGPQLRVPVFAAAVRGLARRAQSRRDGRRAAAKKRDIGVASDAGAAGRQALGAHIRSRLPALIEAWRAAVLADPRLTASRVLPRAQLEDHLPSWLASFAAVLADEPAAERDEARDAEAHGLQRWQQGLDLHDVTREWGCLHRCLVAEFEQLAGSAPAVSAELLSEARMKLADQISEAISSSAEKYFRLERVAASGSVRDLERALADVRVLEKKRAELWQQAAHDLRGNLGVVSNVTQGLHFGDLPPERRQDFLGLLRNNVVALNHLLDDVTDLARLQAGQEQRRVAPFDAAALLRGLAGDLRPLADEKKIFVKAAGPAALVVHGDAVKVRRIAQNLLLNALKYTRAGGVEIAWNDAADGAAWRFSVTDTGPGFRAGPGAPIVNALHPAPPETSTSAAMAQAEEARCRRRSAPDQPGARRGPRPGDRQAPVRPARRQRRDQTAPAQGDGPRPAAAALPRRRPDRGAAALVHSVAIALPGFTTSPDCDICLGPGCRTLPAEEVEMDTVRERAAPIDIRPAPPPAESAIAPSVSRRLRRARGRVAACGGGGDSSTGVAAPAPAPTPAPAPVPAPPAPSASEASRFLAQASMGASHADIAHVQAVGFAAWLDEQFALPASTTRWDALVAAGFADPSFKNGEGGFDACAWRKLLASPDTLRQRVTLALSEIMVTSIDSLTGGGWKAFAAANYLDLLEANAFGNYRTLLEQVSTNTAMGMYLTFRGSMKANPVSGSLPDENYARELMQLFTIGLVKLNLGRNADPDRRRDHADLHARRHHRSGAGLHRLGLQRRRPEPVDGARLPAPADGQHRKPPRNRGEDLPRHHDPGEQRRDADAAARARLDLRACQRRPVRLAPADPAPRHEQPEPGLRRARRDGVQQRRHRNQGQPEGSRQGDPARC